MACSRSVIIPKRQTKSANRKSYFPRLKPLGFHEYVINQPWVDGGKDRTAEESLRERLSAREIALEIGVSRNAVIGKISRLKLNSGERRRSAGEVNRRLGTS